jgi:DinB superfamily
MAPPAAGQPDSTPSHKVVPRWAEEDHICSACDFSYVTVRLADAVEAIRAAPRQTRTAVGAVEPERLRRRPEPRTWSVVEYVCHLRDVYVSSTIRLYRARTEDMPQLEPMLNDLRAQRFRYCDADIPAVLDELGAAVAGCLEEISRFREPDWQRKVMRLPGEERTALWLVRQAAHEARHHLGDIARGW